MARENLVEALEDAVDMLREHAVHDWADFLEDVIANADDEGVLDRLRHAYRALTDVVLEPADTDDNYLFQQRLGQAWINLERLALTA